MSNASTPPPPSDTFDYIVVGAGAAGCIIANRLSADPAVKVALVEAGPSDRRFPTNLKTLLPIGNIFLLPDARYNWQYEFQGGDGVDGRTIACPRGKLLGGSTSVNGTIYVRGHREDFEDWASLGNTGWGYENVLQAYKSHENHAAGADAFHATGGPLDVSRLREPNPIAAAFIDAAVAAGHTRNPDFNGLEQDGFGYFEINQRGGERLSSARAFLHPAMPRPNLTVFTEALVERVRLKGSRAEGITVRIAGQRRELQAVAEVVLCGGTIGSAQLLLLSGIGSATELGRHGIEVRHELPGVGKNLQDHPSVSLTLLDPTRTAYALSWRDAPRVAMAPLRYALSRRGMLASNAAEAGGFIRSRPGLDRPDVQLTLMVGMKESARTMPRRHGIVCHAAVQRPSTRGTLRLVSSDPAAKPLLEPRFLEDRRDVELLKHGLRTARQIVSMPAFARYVGEELGPGRGQDDDEQLERYIRRTATTTYHPVGTCKMGPPSDALAVVDPQLRVHGLEGLRVVDASIMPNIVSGNTAAASMMIGERGASFILERH